MWSWYRLPRILLTASHCLSSTAPRVFEDWFGTWSRYLPPFPVTQFRPRSSLYEMPTAASGWMWFVHHGLNGSVSWYARPFVSKSTVGSVLFIQLGGISCVPVDSHSYPWTMLFMTGVPFTIVYEPLWKSYQVLK